MRTMKAVMALLLTIALLLPLAACGASPAESAAPGSSEAQSTRATEESGNHSPKKAQAADLLEDFTARPVAEKKADESFTRAGFDWAVRLFKETYIQEKDNKTLLVSPLSVMIALTMTANGAQNNTLAEMEKLLGGSVKLEDLNAYLHTCLNSLPSSERAKFSFANAIWFKDQEGFTVKDAFLQKNVDYYDAAIRKAPFDDSTLREINQWVDQHTDHMISELLDKLEPDTRMILVNALVFDAKWWQPFQEDYCQEDVFTDLKGKENTVSFMGSEEYSWLEDEDTIGFVKDYEGGDYRFVALLPKEAGSFEGYVQGLTGEKLSALLTAEVKEPTLIRLPKFTYDYDLCLNDVLYALGMRDAFGPADFSGISDTPLAISQVLHKTHIDLDSEGTRAAAVTAVIMRESEMIAENVHKVYLDRPFVYMIVDGATNLPIFIGTVTGFEK